MVSLKVWARRSGMSDAEIGERIGASPEWARKLRFGARNPSATVAAEIVRLTRGEVGLSDLVPLPRRTAASSKEVRP